MYFQSMRTACYFWVWCRKNMGAVLGSKRSPDLADTPQCLRARWQACPEPRFPDIEIVATWCDLPERDGPTPPAAIVASGMTSFLPLAFCAI